MASYLQTLWHANHCMRFRQHEFLLVLCLAITLTSSLGIYTPLLPLAGLAPHTDWGRPKTVMRLGTPRRFVLNRTDTTTHKHRRLPRARERSPCPRNLGADDFWVFA